MSGRVFSKLLFLFVLVLLLGTTILDVSLRRIVERSLHGRRNGDLCREGPPGGWAVKGIIKPEHPDSLVRQKADAAGARR